MTESPNVVSPLQRYQIIRGQIEHEDNLVSQRLSWLLAAQSFLFTAYAITLNRPQRLLSEAFEQHSGLLMLAVPVVSILSALLIWIAILAGVGAMRQVRRRFEATLDQQFGELLPPLQTSGGLLIAGQLGPMLVPPLFVVVWLVLLLR